MTAAASGRRRPRVGLVVNPVAGLGGTVGLAGSDGEDIQRQALALGARPRAGERAAEAVRALLARCPDVELLTADAKLAVHPAGLDAFQRETQDAVQRETPDAVQPAALGTFQREALGGVPGHGRQDGNHTRRAIQELDRHHQLDLILFAGGDGTARDVLAANPTTPVLGIPAGVKIYSGCFALSPPAAGALAAEWLATPTRPTTPAEVVDLDEPAYRQGLVSPHLHGTLPVPAAPTKLSGRKTGSASPTPASADSIARELLSRMRPGVRYLLGPGTTTAAVGRALNLPTTLLGIDLIADHRLLGSALTERQLLSHLSRTDRPIHAVLSVIGGQGFVLGRGNQQLSPAVLANVSELLILATTQKLAALQGRPLLADTGDPDTDDRLAGYVHVLTGHRESTRYRLAATNPALPSPEGVHP